MRHTLHNIRPAKAKVHIIGGYGVPAVASYFFYTNCLYQEYDTTTVQMFHLIHVATSSPA